MFIDQYNELQRYRITLSFFMAMVLGVWVMISAMSGSQMAFPAAGELVERRISFEDYYQVGLTGLDQIQPLAEDRAMVGGVDLELYTAIQQAYPGLFDIAELDLAHSTIKIEFAIPANIRANEVERFISYQALNYAKLIRRLLPTAEIKNMRVKAFRRGVTVDYAEFNFWFDMPTLIRLEPLPLQKAYKKLNTKSRLYIKKPL